MYKEINWRTPVFNVPAKSPNCVWAAPKLSTLGIDNMISSVLNSSKAGGSFYKDNNYLGTSFRVITGYSVIDFGSALNKQISSFNVYGCS